MDNNFSLITQPQNTLNGSLQVPGDKSISHRALLLSAIADGVSHIEGFLESADTLATLNALRAMNVCIEQQKDSVKINGVGLMGLTKPSTILNCANSGTSMRLLSGILCGQRFSTTLIGDASLSRRPMQRIIKPLTQMNARITASDQGTAPLHIQGDQQLQSINYYISIASAQIKSCLLLAGLYAESESVITESAATRDHTERMLKTLGYPLTQNNLTIRIQGGHHLQATTLKIPGDLSSAAFFIVGSCITPNSEVLLENVGINPTRTGIINILQQMGANITLQNQRWYGNEPVADIRVCTSSLHGIEIPTEFISSAIDEFPILFIAAACAKGKTTLRNAQELRVKESDRIATMIKGLQALGIEAQELEDGAIIQGGKLQGGVIESYDDHRVAMAFAIAGLRASGSIKINNCANIATSFPSFISLCQQAGYFLRQE